MSSLANRHVLVTGGAGFLGRRVVALLEAAGAVVTAPRSSEFDLTVPGAADQMLAEYQPTEIVHLAAQVGGIGYNLAQPAPLYLANLLMGTYIIEAARHASSVTKTVLVGTVCSYPKITPVPFAEDQLWNGYPEESNAPYGIAKKAHLIHAQVNAQQYDQRLAYLIPTNLYGPGDKFHPSVSHVIPALIKKCVEASESGANHVDVWGTGSASREYLYVDDAAQAIVRAAEADDQLGIVEPINLGADREVTTKRPWKQSPSSLASLANCVGTPANPTASRAAASTDPEPTASSAGNPRWTSTRACAPRSTGTSPTGPKPNEIRTPELIDSR
jgi:GDP-L-fucose synthase